MKFSMFFIAEYAHVLTVSMLMATLFLGGWDIPLWQGDDMLALDDGTVIGAAPAWWKTVLTLGAFGLKTFFFIMVFMLVRWTVPRFRYDQVMDLGWKLMLPGALVVLVVTSGTILGLDAAGIQSDRLYAGFIPLYALVLTVVNLVMVAGILWILDKRRFLSGGYAIEEKRAHAPVVAQFHREEWPTSAGAPVRTPATPRVETGYGS